VEIFEPGSGTSIHSYDPGYSSYPGGPLWLTAPGVITKDNIEIHFGKGAAALEFEDVDVHDWITVPNSFSNGKLLGPPAAAVIDVDIEWSNPTRRLSGFTDAKNGFGGNFIENAATIEVAIDNADGSFSFTGAGDSSSCFAQIGKEHNGVFFGS
jgi:hypothetical protein